MVTDISIITIIMLIPVGAPVLQLVGAAAPVVGVGGVGTTRLIAPTGGDRGFQSVQDDKLFGSRLHQGYGLYGLTLDSQLGFKGPGSWRHLRRGSQLRTAVKILACVCLDWSAEVHCTIVLPRAG